MYIVPHLLICVVQCFDWCDFSFYFFFVCGWMLFSFLQQSKSGIVGDGLSPLCMWASCLVDKRAVLVFLAGVTTAPFERGRRSTWVLQNHTGWGDRCKRQRNHGVPCERKGSLNRLQRAADFETRFRRIPRQAAPIFCRKGVVHLMSHFASWQLHSSMIRVSVESFSAWIMRIWQLWNMFFLVNSCLINVCVM